MIADSPYKTGELALSPKMGVVAGFLASLMMLFFIYIFQPISNILLNNILITIGDILFPNFDKLQISSQLMIGIFFHMLLGILLGILYSLSQLSIPPRATIIVGLFYGFILWLVTGLFVGWIAGGEVREIFHSWIWLISCFLYGLTLATLAIWSDNRKQKSDKIALPKD